MGSNQGKTTSGHRTICASENTLDLTFGPNNAVDVPCPFKIPLIHRVVKSRDHNRLMKMISSGVDVNSQDQDGMTPLHYAAAQGDETATQMLTSAGCYQIPCKLNIYPIHLAVQSGNLTVIDTLLNYGGNVDSCDSMGTTPLGLAIEFDQPLIVNLLLKRKAYLSANYLVTSLRQGLLETTRLLINYKPSIVYNQLSLHGYRFNSASTECLKLLYLIGFHFDVNSFVTTNQPEIRYASCNIDFIDRQYKREMSTFNEFLDWLKCQNKPMSLKLLARITLLKACGSHCVENILEDYQIPIPPTIRDYINLKRLW